MHLELHLFSQLLGRALAVHGIDSTAIRQVVSVYYTASVPKDGEHDLFIHIHIIAITKII